MIPNNFEKLRDLIVRLVEKTYAGEVLSVKSNSTQSSQASEANGTSMVKANFVSPSNEIIPEEDEIMDEDSSSMTSPKPPRYESIDNY